MQNTGQAGEKRSYRVILLLVVGLAAFSSAMKELNQVQALTLETTGLVAQWSEKLAPTEKAITVETCQNRQMAISVPPIPALPDLAPLPPAPPVPPVAKSDEVDLPEVIAPEVAPVPPAAPRVPAPPAPKVRRAFSQMHDSAQVRVLISTEDVEKTLKDAFDSDSSLKALKARNRRHILVTTDGKDVILKTLNRSITLRSVS